jgi:quinohemoprotein ethanol dehydrogenase
MNADNIDRLGLAWSMDLGRNNPVTVPLEIDGVLYFASGYSVIHAVNAVNGRLLWTYDPDVPKAAGHKLRSGFGSRGIGYWNGKIYSGTGDGRLIAVDAKSGKLSWSVLTVVKDDGRFITGAPRLFDGKVIIGHGGSDSSATRDYVTTYDARTGKQVWRFFIVPGKPAAGVTDKAQEMAAKTWADLRSSFVPTSAQAFENVVRGGALLQNGMPRFDEFDDATLAAIREYIRSQADVLRKKN